jgi:hypothetical protein
MTPVIILAAIVLGPVILLMLLRVNAALVFLSLCLGDVLSQFVSPDANQFLALFSAHLPKGIDAGNQTIRILLLIAPAILTAIFMIRTLKGHGKLALNLLPAAGVGLLAGLLVVPLLPSGVSNNILSSSLWTQLQHNQDIIVGGSSLICLLVLWLQRPQSGHKKDKHSKH